MADNEITFVPYHATEPWYTNQTFWFGVGSSLIASIIFWYLLHDLQSDASQEGVEPYEAMKKKKKGADDAL